MIKNGKKITGKIKNSLTLMFEPGLEEEYMDYYFAKMRNQITYAIYLGLALFALFGVLDFFVQEGGIKWFWIIRFIVVLPLTGLLAILSKRKIFQKYFQQLQAGLVILGGLSIIAMLLIGSSLVQEVYYAGLILVISYCFIILRLRFIIATSLSLFILFAYQVVIFNLNNLEIIRQINNSFFLVSTFLLGAFSSYYFESIIRRDFLHNRNIEAEKKEISAANDVLEEKARTENVRLKDVSSELEQKITEQKEAFLTIAETERQHYHLIDNMGDGVIVVDSNKNVILCNKAAEQIFGVKEGDLLMKDLSRFMSKDEYTRILQQTTLESNDAPSKFDLTIERPNGENRFIVVSATPYSLKEDSNIGSLGIFHDVTERELANQKIEHSLEEKKVLLMEIHHRVKNNMQIISSLLNLQINYVKDDSSKEQFRICQSRVKTLSLIHEKLYRTKDFINIDFGDYVGSLVRMLYGSYRNRNCQVIFKFNIEKIFLDLNIAIPCALIINELVSNSLKYAFTDMQKGEIEISLTKKPDGIYELIVSDNGGGMDVDVNMSSPSTLGLLLVNSLTSQLHGKLELDKKPGTSIRIYFGEVKLKSYNKLGVKKYD